MAFGAGVKKNGELGAKGIKKLAKQGVTDPNAWLKEHGLSADSKKKDFQTALAKTKAANTAPNNISKDPYEPEVSDVVNENVAPIVNQANQIGQAGKQLLGSGNQNIGEGTSILKDVLGTGLNEYGDRAAIEGQARTGFQDYTQGAIDPTLSANAQQFLDQGSQQRMANINNLYGEGGPERSRLAKELAYNVADLDQLGVGGTTEAALIGDTIGNFQDRRYQAMQQADELSRQEAVGERGRVAGESSTAAGRSLQDAMGQGQLQGNLLGIGKDIGTGLTSAGANQQAIAAELSKLGITGGLGALAEGRAQQGQDVEIDQGIHSYNRDLEQRRIDNENARKDRKRLQEIEDQLREEYLSQQSGGGFLGLF